MNKSSSVVGALAQALMARRASDAAISDSAFETRRRRAVLDQLMAIRAEQLRRLAPATLNAYHTRVPITVGGVPLGDDALAQSVELPSDQVPLGMDGMVRLGSAWAADQVSLEKEAGLMSSLASTASSLQAKLRPPAKPPGFMPARPRAVIKPTAVTEPVGTVVPARMPAAAGHTAQVPELGGGFVAPHVPASAGSVAAPPAAAKTPQSAGEVVHAPVDNGTTASGMIGKGLMAAGTLVGGYGLLRGAAHVGNYLSKEAPEGQNYGQGGLQTPEANNAYGMPRIGMPF